MNLIKDQQQFYKFVNILPELKQDEVYFISLSARNKYLTLEEREYYKLTGTEMFGREIAQTKEKLSTYTIRKLEANLHCKTTRNGKAIPEKSLVVYCNINPSSMVKAYYQFQNAMNRQVSEITVALQNGKAPNYSFVNIQTRELMNCIQKSTGTKHFIDIDCDTKEVFIRDFMCEKFLENNMIFYVIETKGGYHFLIKKDSIPKNRKGTIERSYNFMDIIKEAIIKLTAFYNEEGKDLNDLPEIMINSNAMVPVPGTLQSDFLVKFLEIK